MKTALILPIGLLSASLAIVQAQSPALTTIYNFGAPVGPTNLVAGPNGSLFGAAAGGALGRGFVYQLSPPAQAGAAWTLTVLYNLTASDGTGPVSLALGPEGSLFGATVTDPPANAGTIFEVTPPASGTGAWNGKTLYALTGTPDGAVPNGTLAFGPNGEIYGTTQRGGQSGVGVGGSGTVFELTPTAGGGA